MVYTEGNQIWLSSPQCAQADQLDLYTPSPATAQQYHVIDRLQHNFSLPPEIYGSVTIAFLFVPNMTVRECCSSVIINSTFSLEYTVCLTV